MQKLESKITRAGERWIIVIFDPQSISTRCVGVEFSEEQALAFAEAAVAFHEGRHDTHPADSYDRGERHGKRRVM